MSIEAVSFRRIAAVTTGTDTHTHSQLYRIHRAATPQCIIIMYNCIDTSIQLYTLYNYGKDNFQ